MSFKGIKNISLFTMIFGFMVSLINIVMDLSFYLDFVRIHKKSRLHFLISLIFIFLRPCSYLSL